MINLTTNVQQEAIRKWEVSKFDYDTGVGQCTFYSQGQQQSIPVPFVLSNTPGRSVGIQKNPSPVRWDDIIMSTAGGPGLGGGVGVANALQHAQAAYDGAVGGRNARMEAVALSLLADGVVDAVLTGT